MDRPHPYGHGIGCRHQVGAPLLGIPYNDVSVVHNGQITNYWIMRREMERKGHRFMSNCDSELLAVYTAHNLCQRHRAGGQPAQVHQRD